MKSGIIIFFIILIALFRRVYTHKFLALMQGRIGPHSSGNAGVVTNFDRLARPIFSKGIKPNVWLIVLLTVCLQLLTTSFFGTVFGWPKYTLFVLLSFFSILMTYGESEFRGAIEKANLLRIFPDILLAFVVVTLLFLSSLSLEKVNQSFMIAVVVGLTQALLGIFFGQVLFQKGLFLRKINSTSEHFSGAFEFLIRFSKEIAWQLWVFLCCSLIYKKSFEYPAVLIVLSGLVTFVLDAAMFFLEPYSRERRTQKLQRTFFIFTGIVAVTIYWLGEVL